MKKSAMLSAAISNIIRSELDLTNAAVFLRNLQFVRSLIVATEGIFEAAKCSAPKGQIRDYLAHHMEEERDHFKWLSEDLGDHAVSAPLMAEAVAMAGSQYYLIYHFDPVSVLGYMAVLEFFPMIMEKVEELESIHGENLCRTLRYHAQHDLDHGSDLREIIDGLSDEQFIGVLNNAMQTAHYMESAIRKMS